MRKGLMAGVALFAAGAVAATITINALGPLGAANAANSETYRQLNLFGDVFDRIRSDYVEQPEDSKLIDAAINGMLAALDPHSSYLNAKGFQDMQVQTRGEFGGLGIEVTMEEGVIKVVTPIDDTPAARADVRGGDLIVKLDGEPILGLTLGQAVEKMRGQVNTPIILTIKREGVDEPFDVKIVRDIIQIRSVRYRVEDDVGYIRITTFNEQTQQGLNRAVKKLEEELGDKVKGYVLDLRNNPGGLLDQAISVSDSFLDRGEIVSTRGRNAEQTQRYNADAGDLLKTKPLVILINGGSASASEIVAGALQDHRRATILGTRSFGKGSVQTIIPLGSMGAIRLTTARYYTPSGRSIQAKGIDPDIVVEQNIPDEQKKKTVTKGEANLPNHLKGDEEDEKDPSGSSTFIPTDKTKDTQLTYALNLLRGVKVDNNAATEKTDKSEAPEKAEEPEQKQDSETEPAD